MALQGGFTCGFAGLDCFNVVVECQAGINRGIPDALIDAIDDSKKVLPSRGQHALQPAAVVGRLNLLGVTWADGVEEVRVDDARLEETDLPVEFEMFVGKQPPWK